MQIQVHKWGNSLAVRIPKQIATEADVKEGSLLDVSVTRGALLAKPVRDSGLRLSDMLAAIKPASLHAASDWGEPTGREVW